MNDIRTTLDERGKNYGEFRYHAALAQGLKDRFWQHVENQDKRSHFSAAHIEALDMIFHKLARIGNGGNPNYADTWRDIVGYAQLVLDILEPPPLKATVDTSLIADPKPGYRRVLNMITDWVNEKGKSCETSPGVFIEKLWKELLEATI